MTKGVVYSAEITDLTTSNKDTYTGLTDGTIRDRIMRGTNANETRLYPFCPETLVTQTS